MWHSGLVQDQDQDEGPDLGQGGGHGQGHATDLGQGPGKVVAVGGPVVVAEEVTLGQSLDPTTEKEHEEGVTPLHPHPLTLLPVPVPPLVLLPAPDLGAGAETSDEGGPAADLEHLSKRSQRRRKLLLQPNPPKRSQ